VKKKEKKGYEVEESIGKGRKRGKRKKENRKEEKR
jgi:hypothetical protein